MTLEERNIFCNAVQNLDTNKAVVGWKECLFSSLDTTSEKELVFTESELQTEVDRLQAQYDANQYQRDRQYPSIGDQLDMQYHDQLNGTTTWKDAIAKVKADNPKEAE